MTFRPLRAASAAASVASMLLAAGCGRPAPPSGATERLVIVAVDGATWNIMSPLMSRGQLPRLASLVRGGSAGRLNAPEPLRTAPLWTSVATGRLPEDHGIVSDVVRVSGRYALRPVTADMRRAPALWTIASRRGVAVGLIGWPATFPAETVEGYLVSEEWDPVRAEPPRGAHPREAIGDDGDGEDRLVIPDRLAPVAALDETLRDGFERDLENLARGMALYRVHQPAIALFRFQSIDGASHRFWPYMERRFLDVMARRGEAVPPELADARARAIPGAYEMFDAWIGMLMDRIPEDATLLIVSNHGFRGIEPGEDLRVDLNLLLRALGFQEAAAGGDPDWTRTRAFALEGEAAGPRGVFLNVEGRETGGSLDPASAERLAVELTTTLEALSSTGGRKIVSVRAGPGDGSGPDLLVTQALGLSPDDAIVLGAETIHARDVARPTGVFGVHDTAGIVLAFGRGIARAEPGWDADILDVLPTALHLAGIAPPEELPGKVMTQLLADPAAPADGTAYDQGPAAPAEAMMPAPAADRMIDVLRRRAHLLF